MSILIAESLEKKYRSRKVVNNLSFNIKSGEIIGLLGPNGAGKTTAFYMTVGLVSCSSGKITLDDLDITNYPIHKRARIGIGYLPQEASVFRKLTVQENILAVLEMRGNLSETKRSEILEKLIDQLNLNEIRNTIGMSLSGGERRRVEIARTLSIEPKFILLDEPFAGVDPISVLDIQRIIKSLHPRASEYLSQITMLERLWVFVIEAILSVKVHPLLMERQTRSLKTNK